MSSYHPRTIVAPPRRSASSAVAQALRNANRPRSAGSLYSANGLSSFNPYAALSSTYSPPSSSTSSYLSSSPSHHSSYTSPSYKSSTPSSTSSSSFLSPSSYKPNLSRRSAASSSRHSPSRFSGMGSRSGSSTSLSALSTKSDGSEGYASEDKSRLGSVSSLTSSQPEENGEIDYKKLYEAEHAINERLRETLRKTEDELSQVRTGKNPAASEAEKRERRAMERKLSEMEEELKQLQKLKAENERLKAENRALTRVVSKLTNSTHK